MYVIFLDLKHGTVYEFQKNRNCPHKILRNLPGLIILKYLIASPSEFQFLWCLLETPLNGLVIGPSFFKNKISTGLLFPKPFFWWEQKVAFAMLNIFWFLLKFPKTIVVHEFIYAEVLGRWLMRLLFLLVSLNLLENYQHVVHMKTAVQVKYNSICSSQSSLIIQAKNGRKKKTRRKNWSPSNTWDLLCSSTECLIICREFAFVHYVKLYLLCFCRWCLSFHCILLHNNYSFVSINNMESTTLKQWFKY